MQSPQPEQRSVNVPSATAHGGRGGGERTSLRAKIVRLPSVRCIQSVLAGLG